MQGAGCRVQGVGCRVQSAGCRVQGAGCRVQGAGCRVQGAGCRVQGAGCRVQGAGFRVQGSGCGAESREHSWGFGSCEVVKVFLQKGLARCHEFVVEVCQLLREESLLFEDLLLSGVAGLAQGLGLRVWG